MTQAEAFSALFEQHFEKLACVLEWRAPGMGAELAAEAFAKGWASYQQRSFNDRRHEVHWLYRIGINLAIDHLRAHHPLPFKPEGYQQRDPDDPHDIAARREFVDRLKVAMRPLTTEQRSVLRRRLAGEDHMSNRERALVYRATQRLRKDPALLEALT